MRIKRYKTISITITLKILKIETRYLALQILIYAPKIKADKNV